MPRKKLKKMLEVDSFANVFHTNSHSCSSELKAYFVHPGSITLEIGCGRGDYSITLAQACPQRNFVGVDVKGARLWTAARRALNLGVKNVAFLRTRAETLTEYFQPAEIDEIWIPFPDPFPKKRNVRRRVTGPAFLEVYQQVLKKGGKVHLKTDDQAFFDFTLANLSGEGLPVFESVEDLYQSQPGIPEVGIQTKYEQQHLADGRTIKYVCFGFN